MTFTKINVYDGINVEKNGDPYSYLFADTEIVMQGDDYHDGITDRIDGFLQGAQFAYERDLVDLKFGKNRTVKVKDVFDCETELLKKLYYEHGFTK